MTYILLRVQIEKTKNYSNLYCVGWGVKLYSLTAALFCSTDMHTDE